MRERSYFVLIQIIAISFNIGLTQEGVMMLDPSNPTLNEDCKNGDIQVDIDFGVTPYDVVWTGPNGYYYEANGINGNNDGEDIFMLDAGTYSVTVTDGTCCSASTSISVVCQCSEDCEVVAGDVPA